MNKPDFLFLIGGAVLEILAIKQLLTAKGFAEGGNEADHHLYLDARLADAQNLLNNAQANADIELFQNIDPAPVVNTNFSSNTLYPPCIPGCGLNKTSLN